MAELYRNYIKSSQTFPLFTEGCLCELNKNTFGMFFSGK